MGSATGLQSSFGQTSASGTTLLNVTDGVTVRLVFGGRNLDGARFLRGTLTLDYRDVVETVPLPPSAWLLCAAIAGVALRRRRQNSLTDHRIKSTLPAGALGAPSEMQKGAP